MVWAAALPYKYSNNILYTLKSGNNTEYFKNTTFKQMREIPYICDGFRQNGNKAHLCGNIDFVDSIYKKILKVEIKNG